MKPSIRTAAIAALALSAGAWTQAVAAEKQALNQLVTAAHQESLPRVAQPVAEIVVSPEPSTIVCVGQTEYKETAYCLVPWLGGLCKKSIEGSLTVSCPERQPVSLSISGGGFGASLNLPTGGNPFVHHSAAVSAAVNVRAPSLVTPKQFEGTYVKIAGTTPIGGISVSPFTNTNLDAEVSILLPSSLDVSFGISLNALTLTLK